jgi:DNA-directed RNA polymerase specialized sigma24 family protein
MRRLPSGMGSVTEPNEAIAAAVDGDLGAFEERYRLFAPRIDGLCLRLTGQREAAEDCTQESSVAA